MEVWKLVKSLNLSQSITDGGSYTLQEVFFLKPESKRPGLGTFSDLRLLSAHRSIKTGSLGDRDWSAVFVDPTKHFLFSELDQLAYDHVNNFWSSYGLKLKIGVEHKMSSTALKTAHFAKAHYPQLTWNPEDREL